MKLFINKIRQILLCYLIVAVITISVSAININEVNFEKKIGNNNHELYCVTNYREDYSPTYVNLQIDFEALEIYFSEQDRDLDRNHVINYIDDGQLVYFHAHYDVVPEQYVSQWLWENIECHIYLDSNFFDWGRGFDKPYDPNQLVGDVYWVGPWDAVEGSHNLAFEFDKYDNITETDPNNNNIDLTFDVFNSDILCSGDIDFGNVPPGSIQTGSFQVLNSGGPGSLLDWEVTDWPKNWGQDWQIIPYSGDDLAEGDAVNVDISFKAPEQADSLFSGSIKVINKNNPSEFDTIIVTLKTPKIKLFASPIFEFLTKFFPLFNRLFI